MASLDSSGADNRPLANQHFTVNAGSRWRSLSLSSQRKGASPSRIVVPVPLSVTPPNFQAPVHSKPRDTLSLYPPTTPLDACEEILWLLPAYSTIDPVVAAIWRPSVTLWRVDNNHNANQPKKACGGVASLDFYGMKARVSSDSKFFTIGVPRSSL